jgi:hypothetical protein
MPDQYELTIDGLAAADLVPLKEELSKIARENGSVKFSERALRKLAEAERVPLPDPDQQAERLAKVTEHLHEGGLEVSSKRILPLYYDWGNEERYAEDDVKELSSRHPEKIFYLITVTAMEEFGEIDTLEHYQRQRFQDGQLTAVYDAEPIVWTPRF